MFKHFQAEIIKLKYAPIIWLFCSTIVVVAMLIFFGHSNDLESISAIGKNPWDKIWNATIGIFSIFMNGPFLILLICACFYIESHNNALKYQYTVPHSRVKQLITKLCTIILIVLLLLSLLGLIIFLTTQFLSMRYPEIEFYYYPVHAITYLEGAMYTLINSLGLIGVQYFMSIRFRGFLLPASLGVINFILGLILGIVNIPISHYWPYSYPLIGQDFNMFTIDNIGIQEYGIINSVQISSVAILIFFTSLAIYMEHRRSV